jgi:Zn-dependent peptidase ImmA (M78 family)
VLRTDYRYFISQILDKEEAGVLKVYRALAAPTAVDKFAIRRFINFAVAERELASILGEKVTQPPSATSLEGRLHKDQGANAARRERERLALGNRPIENIFELLRANGVLVFRHSLADSDLSGLTIAHDRAGVAVLINYVDDLYRQFFSAAHEYGHVVLDRRELQSTSCIVSYNYSREALLEIRANAFAAEFLLPTGALARYERDRRATKRDELVLRIARDYRVNTQTVVIRMAEAGWVDAETTRAFLKAPSVRVPRSAKVDPDVPETLTEKQKERRLRAIQDGVSASFLEAIRRALVAHEITWGRAAELLELQDETAEGFMEAVGAAAS